MPLAIRLPEERDRPNTLDSSVWETRLGEQVLALEIPILNRLTRRLHGDSALWIGEVGECAHGLQRCMVKNPVHLTSRPYQGDGVIEGVASLNAVLDNLPFKTSTFDGVVLHHALEHCDDPRTVLREVTRILAPGGRLIVVGFNPVSLVGLRRLYARVVADAISAHRLVNPVRLLDWLTLLGFELQSRPRYLGFSLPSVTLTQWLSNRFDRSFSEARVPIPLGGLIVLEAVKQAPARHGHWIQRRSDRRLAPVAYPRVSSWREAEDRT